MPLSHSRDAVIAYRNYRLVRMDLQQNWMAESWDRRDVQVSAEWLNNELAEVIPG